MTKPMLCPMSFVGHLGEETSLLVECTPDCAWACKRQGRYFCSIPAKLGTEVEEINSRPLKDDTE